MKKLGIIGGMGPESTLEYYKMIVHKCRKQNKTGDSPDIVIESVNIAEMLRILNTRDFSRLKEFILSAVENIYRAGAEFGAIASNTPHLIFEELEKSSPIPLLSIVNETFKKVKEKNCDKVGLLGTKFTMEEDFYKKIFRLNDIAISVPDKSEHEYINDKIFNELEYGIIKDETKKNFLSIIESMKKKHGIESLILGCTELPFIIKDEDVDIALFNTTDIHINSIVEYML